MIQRRVLCQKFSIALVFLCICSFPTLASANDQAELYSRAPSSDFHWSAYERLFQGEASGLSLTEEQQLMENLILSMSSAEIILLDAELSGDFVFEDPALLERILQELAPNQIQGCRGSSSGWCRFWRRARKYCSERQWCRWLVKGAAKYLILQIGKKVNDGEDPRDGDCGCLPPCTCL